MRMGSEIHIQRFYDTEGILHRERLMMVNELSVRVKMRKSPFEKNSAFILYIKADG